MYLLVIKIEFSGQGYGTEWMDRLTELLRSHLIGAPIPLDDFYNLVQQLEAWRISIITAFKPAAQIIGGVSGRCTESSIRVYIYICNASRC